MIVYSKIALGNVKKSFKDYTIYFLTLTLAVCIFYSFNSIESQRAMLELNKTQSDNLKSMLQIISYISVFVSVILGCLIVYANNFLIKKRKKELGIYMTLGMSKNKISKILTIETMLVGLFSLISGLLLGLFVSQGLSVLTSKLFDVSMKEFQFTISFSAMGKTIIYFGIIFILVVILNSFIITKYKIIDLLTSAKRNEDIKIKNAFLYVLIFILGVACLTYAYNLILKNGFLLNASFSMSIILGIIGTVFIFFSLAGFLLTIVKKLKKIYYKDLNIFIVKQINSKINTNFLSMSVICLMLFLTIVMLSTGLSFKDSMEKSLESSTPFDATLTMYLDENDNTNIKDTLSKLNFKFDENEKYVYLYEYINNETVKQSLEKYVNNDQKNSLEKSGQTKISYIKLSEYNAIRKLQNKDTLTLGSDEVLITSNFSELTKLINNILKDNNRIDIGNKTYLIKNKTVVEDSIRSSSIPDNIFTVVVNDKIINEINAKPFTQYLNINYDENNRAKTEKKYATLFEDFFEGKIKLDDDTGFIIGYTKDQIYEVNKGMSTIMVFIGIYLGIIFLISSMAVLSLQQLSEASDSLDRYKSLRRIGADEKMINKTIFTQTLIYFLLPLVLALIHSVVAIKVINDFVSLFGKVDIGMSSLLTALIFVIVYLGYFLTTYSGYKSIVKNS